MVRESGPHFAEPIAIDLPDCLIYLVQEVELPQLLHDHL